MGSKKNYALQKNCSYKDLSELIITAIQEEQFFNKETLIPKVKAILTGFKMNINSTKYDGIETPSDAARRIRAIEEYEVVVNFWKCRMKELGANMSEQYLKLDDLLIERGFRPKNKNHVKNEHNQLG